MYSVDLIMMNVMVDERLMRIFPCDYGYFIYGGSVIMAIFFPTLFLDNHYYILLKIGIASTLVSIRMIVYRQIYQAIMYMSASFLTMVFYRLYRQYYNNGHPFIIMLFCVVYHYMLGVVIYFEDSTFCGECHGSIDLLRWISWYCHALALSTLCWNKAGIYDHTNEDHYHKDKDNVQPEDSRITGKEI
jgi:hypothetical protein